MKHLAAGEALFAPSIPAQPHKLRRSPYRAHHGLELFQPVGMTVRKHGQVTLGEGRLAPRNGVERDSGIGDDPRAVCAGDLAMLYEPVGLQPIGCHALGGGADLVLGLEVDFLFLKRPVIDPRFDTELGQALVDVASPRLAPAFKNFYPVPVADLGAEAVPVHRAHGEHDMGVGLGPAVFADVPMDIEVGDHALGDKFPFDEIPRQFDALAFVQFARNRELDLAGELGVLAFLGGFDRVPKRFTFPERIGNALGRYHLGMNDAALAHEIVMAIETPVIEPRGRAIGGRGERARSVGAGNNLRGKMIDRHAGRFTLRNARRHDV